MTTSASPVSAPRPARPALPVFWVFLRLGVTSFGGPIAHLGYFRAEFVHRRRWLEEAVFADLVALFQFLPGPTSSQVGMAIGLYQAGWRGLIAAWCGFTLPSAAALVLFAYGVDTLAKVGSGWLHGLKIVAVVIVAQAVWGMAKSLCPDRPRATVAVISALLVLFVPFAYGQVGAILLAGIFGWRFLKASGDQGHAVLPLEVGRRTAILCLTLFFTLLVLLPVAHGFVPSHVVALIDSFYRSGALVFGGGHVVLPLLQAEVIPPGWISSELFLAGYGAAQAVPGPLFTFVAYLGAAQRLEPNGVLGAAICLFSVYLPSFLLLVGALPFWEALRTRQPVRSALAGVNAAVVGLLVAALYEPVWTSAIRRPADFGLGLSGFLLLQMWKVPPWAVVALTAIGGAVLAWLSMD